MRLVNRAGSAIEIDEVRSVTPLRILVRDSETGQETVLPVIGLLPIRVLRLVFDATWDCS
jgi:hypothetical protein